MQPWYEVASTGDGISPESVNIWTIPPKLVVPPVPAAGALRGNPPGVTVQDPTKWNGDHVSQVKRTTAKWSACVRVYTCNTKPAPHTT